GPAEVGLEGDPLSPSLAGRRALHLALVVPGVVLVLGALGAIAGCARIPGRGDRIRHGLDGIGGGDVAAHRVEKESDVVVGQGQAQLPADGPQLVWSRKLCARHGSPPSCYARCASTRVAIMS